MGYKIAEIASKRKHVVTLISGPTKLSPPKVKKFISIETASDLLKALKQEVKNADCLIMSAAVGDFSVERVLKQKLKRAKHLSLALAPNKDILKALSKYKKNKLYIGFSLETEDPIQNSHKKLKNKNLDIIVANRLTKRCNVFGDNRLDAHIIDKDGVTRDIKRKSKAFIAHVLLDKIEKLWYLKSNQKIEDRREGTEKNLTSIL